MCGGNDCVFESNVSDLPLFPCLFLCPFRFNLTPFYSCFLFTRQLIEHTNYECDDSGSFYTCGQQGTAFINRGNVLRNNTFRRVRQEDKSVLCKLGDSSIEIADSSIENEGHSVET